MEWSHRIFNRHCDPLLTVCIQHRITPNMVTVANFFFTLTAGVYFFAQGTWAGSLYGLMVCGVNVVLDYLDGALAKETGQISAFGLWFDTYGDIVIQNSIMAAIAYGLLSGNGMVPAFPLPAVIMSYFVSRIAMNAISFNYNSTFGFDSYKGNKLFRAQMERRPSLVNRLLKNIIDPTSSGIGLFLFTVRYWIVIGALFNCMQFVFMFVTVLLTFQCIVMYLVYGLYLLKNQNLWVLKVLAMNDQESEAYFAVRDC